MTILTLTDGEELYYEVHGQGPPLVLISGLNGVDAFWKPHLEVLSRNFTVILHDHRGTGRSSPSRIDYSIEQMAGDLVELLDHLEIGQADMVGHLAIKAERIDVVPLAPRPAFQILEAWRVRQVRARLNLPERYLLYIGTIEPRKNLSLLLDVWQADASGTYYGVDGGAYRLRGRFETASDGRYGFETIMPGRYAVEAGMRPAHIHFRVSLDGFATLTTQLYFEGDRFLAPIWIRGRFGIE